MKSLHFALFAICLIAISGCNVKTAFLKKDIATLMKTELHMPILDDAIIYGRDTTIVLVNEYDEGAMKQRNAEKSTLPLFGNALARMIVLFDSTICGSCKVSRIGEYQLAVEYAKAMHGGFEPIFIFAPSKDKERDLQMALMGHPFEWPIFIDAEQKFLQANPHIPKNKALHTFLLDKNNRVVLVGDPIGNDKLWGLYMKTIRELIDNAN